MEFLNHKLRLCFNTESLPFINQSNKMDLLKLILVSILAS